MKQPSGNRLDYVASAVVFALLLTFLLNRDGHNAVRLIAIIICAGLCVAALYRLVRPEKSDADGPPAQKRRPPGEH